jgi:hypothetical protein
VGDLAVGERLRNDADDVAAPGHHRIGDDAHQSDIPAAIHQADPAIGEHRAKRFRRHSIRRLPANARSAKHAYPSH